MKIRKITFTNHSVFGDLELDFTDKNGTPINTIIIAGENGVGKSLLLNTIFEFSNYGMSTIQRDEKRIFEIQLSDQEIEILKLGSQYFQSKYQDNILKILFDYNIIGSWEQIDIRGKTENGFSPTMMGSLFKNNDNSMALKTIFSDVGINFTPREIKTVTSRNIDNLGGSQRSNQNLATEITQLLIDVQSIDALEFTEWSRENIGKPIEKDKIDERLKRFTIAFDFMFPTKRYKGIQTIADSKRIIFEENGKKMTINELSSGEKQIVFRGSFLLKDKESSKGALILIDEPEISLHPSWQLKVLSFFKKLFTNEQGEQTSQLIITTYSPFIIHNANRNDDKVIILQKDSQGKISVLKDPKFYSWSSEKIVEEAFNVSPFLSLNKLIVFVAGETDEKYFNSALKLFDKSDDIEFRWIGKTNDKGQAEFTGDSALDKTKTVFCSNQQLLRNKMILYYDSDANKAEETVGNLLIRSIPKNEQNTIYKIGVENLLCLPKEFDTSLYIKETIKTDGYSVESARRELYKTKLCDYICDEMKPEDQKKMLTNFNNEIDRLLGDKENNGGKEGLNRAIDRAKKFSKGSVKLLNEGFNSSKIDLEVEEDRDICKQ